MKKKNNSQKTKWLRENIKVNSFALLSTGLILEYNIDGLERCVSLLPEEACQLLKEIGFIKDFYFDEEKTIMVSLIMENEWPFYGRECVIEWFVFVMHFDCSISKYDILALCVNFEDNNKQIGVTHFALKEVDQDDFEAMYSIATSYQHREAYKLN